MNNFATTLIRWGYAFLIGSMLGLIAERFIVHNAIHKDCEIIGAFRIGDTAYHCKMTKP